MTRPVASPSRLNDDDDDAAADDQPPFHDDGGGGGEAGDCKLTGLGKILLKCIQDTDTSGVVSSVCFRYLDTDAININV